MKFSLASCSLCMTLYSLTDVSSAFVIMTRNHAISKSMTAKTTSTSLFGILDEIKSDSFNLFENRANSEISSDMDRAYDIFLAKLVFSTKDPRLDIMDNYDLATDDQWLTWLQKKIDRSRDAEEKVALKDLREMIVDIKKRVELSRLAEEREAKERLNQDQQEKNDNQIQPQVKVSNAEVLKKARGIDTGGISDNTGDELIGSSKHQQSNKSFLDTDLTPEIRMSYDELLRKVLPPYKSGETAETVVYNNYDQIDAQFIKVLTERANNGDSDSEIVLSALGKEQGKRLANAMESIRSVLSVGDPMRMEGVIVKLAREGKIDEPFLLLLEANIKQAEEAGAMGPAKVMRKLATRATEEKDKQSATKEIKLLRKLLRTDDPTERELLLEDAFTPKDKFLVEGSSANAAKAADGEQPEQEKPMPDVPPPDFINACKAVLLNFGNIASGDGSGDLASRIKTIASEAEAVATKIYGKGMSVREQQDRMWAEQTTSIFDLETLEIEAERRGDKAPWAKDADDNDIIPGFDKDGRMQIGGR